MRPSTKLNRSIASNPTHGIVTKTADQSSGFGAAQKRMGAHILVPLFIIALAIPVIINIGTLRFSVYRFVLLAALIPCLIGWISGKSGRIRFPDIAILLLWFWSTLTYAIIHGAANALEPGGVMFLELVGSYMLGRVMIRSADEFLSMSRTLFWIVAIFLPLAAYEAVAGVNLILKAFGSIFTVMNEVNKEPRWGLQRVQGPFEHPILFGVFAGSALALSYLVLGHKGIWLMRFARAGIVGAAAFLSLSSGPATALIAQVMLLTWDGALKNWRSRWMVLTAASLSMIIAIEIAARRSTAAIFISLFAFDKDTAYSRLHIWQYGARSIWNHPWLGIGNNDWERPIYMASSIDMFWIVPPMRAGLPAGVFLAVAFFGMFLSVAYKKISDERVLWYKTAWLICMTGFFLAGWTVHYWNATYVLLMFLLGSGSWILEYRTPEEVDAAERARNRRRKQRVAAESPAAETDAAGQRRVGPGKSRPA